MKEKIENENVLKENIKESLDWIKERIDNDSYNAAMWKLDSIQKAIKKFLVGKGKEDAEKT